VVWLEENDPVAKGTTRLLNASFGAGRVGDRNVSIGHFPIYTQNIWTHSE